MKWLHIKQLCVFFKPSHFHCEAIFSNSFNANPWLSACRAALRRYMYFHLYKHRKPGPSHQAGELRNPCNLPRCQKTNKKAGKWIQCICVSSCSPVSPGGVCVWGVMVSTASHTPFTQGWQPLLCAFNVHNGFAVFCFCLGLNTVNGRVGPKTGRLWVPN